MPGRPRARRSPAIATLQFRLLVHEVTIDVEDEALASAVAYVANGAEQDVPRKGAMRYAVRGRGPYEIFEEGDRVGRYETVDDVIFVLYGRAHARLLDHMTLAGWVPFHGGLVAFGARRVVVLGEKGAGKTTLMLRLLHDGWSVEGDELVLTRDGEALCLPRAFHVKPGTRAIVPELDRVYDDLPFTSTADGERVVAYDPSRFGFEWRIAPGPVHGGVLLRAGHNRPAELAPIPNLTLVREALDHSFPISDSRSALLGTTAALLGEVDAYELHVGPVRDCATALATAFG